ncbi:hypothetical protein T4B_14977 [Trichinella pseudospiralis]|uniref:Uncharacterized protein n=1 Tax=Trichinella pseudospiralis TaxID=6337 RepID=A0A0V1KCN3_TRIPS|nr:hypothetical protein T4B_14977 [Trichinella pseudospiralis]KRZ44999.1 hypothetical protein T4C_4231 [Trichinella pseudospiralis]
MVQSQHLLVDKYLQATFFLNLTKSSTHSVSIKISLADGGKFFSGPPSSRGNVFTLLHDGAFSKGFQYPWIDGQSVR